MLRLAKVIYILCAKFQMKQIHLWWVFIAADIEPSTEVLGQKKVGKSRQRWANQTGKEGGWKFTFSVFKELCTLLKIVRADYN